VPRCFVSAGLCTDWAGSSMSIPPISDAYAPTVGALAPILTSGSAVAAGDSAKVARVVLQVADMDEPPLRLLLGSGAVT
jgi:hypothetical protein